MSQSSPDLPNPPSEANIKGGARLLLAVAAPAEARAVLLATGGDPSWAELPWQRHPLPGGACDLLITGIGKANAAGAVARALDPTRHRAVLSFGIAGALPGPAAPQIGAPVLASESVYADEGLLAEDDSGVCAFRNPAEMGFPLGPPPISGGRIPAAPSLVSALRPLASVVAPVATVSTCSGTDALAAMVAERTGAVAEAMEGAAVLHVVARVSPQIPAAEFRVISNTTGRRSRQVWDIRAALGVLTDLTRPVIAACTVAK